MTTEVLERLRVAIEAAAEQVDEMLGPEGAQERLDEAMALLEQLEPKQLELPLWDERVHADAELGIAWRHVGGHKVVVDLCDADLLIGAIRIDMVLRSSGPESQAISSVRINHRGHNVPLGRVILIRANRWTDGLWVDHVDHDVLNYRRNNLRGLTPKESARHRRAYGKVKYLYVYECDGGRYRASVAGPNRRPDGRLSDNYVGRFDTPEEAARAADAMAIKLYGPGARTNVSLGLLPPLPEQLEMAV